MEPPHALVRTLAERLPADLSRGVAAVLAVSGGADSVALLRGVCELRAGNWRLSVAHFNHRLRGTASAADQQFVERLCQQLEIDCQTGLAGALPSGGDGLEAAARAARYEFLRETAEARGARYVLTAHTVDDQAETVLHHILRGTGLRGLAGIRRVRALGPAVSLVRPLLEVGRSQVLDFLSSIEQDFCHDASNDCRDFTRNRIRNELLPLLARDYAPGVVESLVRLSQLAADTQRVVDGTIEPLLDRALGASHEHEVTLDCAMLASHDRHLVRELMVALWQRQGWPQQAMGFAEWNLLADMALLAAPPGEARWPKRMLPGAITAERQGDRLTLRGAQ